MNTTATINSTSTWPPPNTALPQPYNICTSPPVDQVNRRAVLVQFASIALQGLLAREGSYIHKDSELVEQAWNIAKMMLDEGNNKHQLYAW